MQDVHKELGGSADPGARHSQLGLGSEQARGLEAAYPTSEVFEEGTSPATASHRSKHD